VLWWGGLSTVPSPPLPPFPTLACLCLDVDLGRLERHWSHTTTKCNHYDPTSFLTRVILALTRPYTPLPEPYDCVKDAFLVKPRLSPLIRRRPREPCQLNGPARLCPILSPHSLTTHHHPSVMLLTLFSAQDSRFSMYLIA
jgi:hypothetical protein